jgi:hypothetical protein
MAICSGELFGDRISDWRLLDFENPQMVKTLQRFNRNIL